MMKIVILCTYLEPAMFLLYHSDRCNTSETVFYWCYVNDLHTTHAVVCWVTTVGSLPLAIVVVASLLSTLSYLSLVKRCLSSTLIPSVMRKHYQIFSDVFRFVCVLGHMFNAVTPSSYVWIPSEVLHMRQ
jgi:hypothetical protein